MQNCWGMASPGLGPKPKTRSISAPEGSGGSSCPGAQRLDAPGDPRLSPSAGFIVFQAFVAW